MAQRRTPSGELTGSVRVYLREWRKIIRPIEKRLGVTVTAFDPDLFVRLNGANCNCSIPLWLAEKILEEK